MSDDLHTSGQVREWRDEEGWGVLDSLQTAGGCWAHFSVVDGEGFKSLLAGQMVEFRYEHGQQDGFAYRATWVHALD